MAPAEDSFTLQQLASELAQARQHIQKATGLDDDMVCRMILTTRMANLPLARCQVCAYLHCMLRLVR